MSHMSKVVFSLVILVVLSLACGFGDLSPAFDDDEEEEVLATGTAPVVAQETPEPTIAVEVTESPVDEPVADDPLALEAQYLERLQSKEFEAAAEMYSDYSLSVFGITRSDVMSELVELDFDGWELEEYRVVQGEPVDEKTTLVKVLFRAGWNGQIESSEIWTPWRREDSGWKRNWGGLVDTRTITAETQMTNGVSVRPVEVYRFDTGMQLLLEIENGNDRTVWWGWPTDTIVTFTFPEGAVDITGSVKLEPLRQYPEFTATIDEYRENYPTSVQLKGWRWAVEGSPNLAEPAGEKWEYEFDLTYED